MAFYFVTGKLGNGKSLCSIGRIRDKLRAGCTVATNCNLNLSSMFKTTTKDLNVIRVPDKPTLSDLQCLGNANETYDEAKNGLLVLDECGTWFNSRSWQDKTRKDVNDWMLHARKLGWDVILIVQDIAIIDSQARMALSEMTVFCRRLDRLRIPFLSSFIKTLTGYNITMPKIHRAKVCYGVTPQDMVCDVWTFTGTDLYACYDTKQLFLSDYSDGPYSYLTPWHVVGRHQVKRDKEYYMRITKIMWKRFKSPVALCCGVLAGVTLSLLIMGSAVINSFDKGQQHTASNQTEDTSHLRAPTKATNILSGIDNLYISGSMNINGDFKYQFSRQQKDATDELVIVHRSHDLLRRGVAITAYNECHASLTKDGIEMDVYCY